MPPAWQTHLPNLITMLRLVLAAGFFVSLQFYWHGRTGPTGVNIAVILFILAAGTDALDGYLARRWNVVSLFGRIMDPVCDKVLIIGAFICLAGPRFVMPERAADGHLFAMSTGVYSWMVVVIVFRELLITGMRSVAEALNVDFSANWWGKWKMILQTIMIPTVLVIAANLDLHEHRWAVWFRDALVWLTLIVTVGSGVPYVLQCRRVFREMNSGTSNA